MGSLNGVKSKHLWRNIFAIVIKNLLIKLPGTKF